MLQALLVLIHFKFIILHEAGTFTTDLKMGTETLSKQTNPTTSRNQMKGFQANVAQPEPEPCWAASPAKTAPCWSSGSRGPEGKPGFLLLFGLGVRRQEALCSSTSDSSWYVVGAHKSLC